MSNSQISNAFWLYVFLAVHPQYLIDFIGKSVQLLMGADGRGQLCSAAAKRKGPTVEKLLWTETFLDSYEVQLCWYIAIDRIEYIDIHKINMNHIISYYVVLIMCQSRFLWALSLTWEYFVWTSYLCRQLSAWAFAHPATWSRCSFRMFEEFD